MTTFQCFILLVLSLSVASTKSPTHTFAWISDVHLDPIYNPVISQDWYCRNQTSTYSELVQQQLQQILSNRIVNPSVDWFNYRYHQYTPNIPLEFSGSSSYPFLPAYHGRYGCDAPPTLLWAMLLSLREKIDQQPVDFVLLTGDLVGHYWSSKSERFRMASLLTATDMIYRALFLNELPTRPITSDNQLSLLNELINDKHASLKQERVQVIMCPGNNDMEVDYMVEMNSKWNEILWDTWSIFGLPQSQKAAFLKGGYYAWTLEKSPSNRVICLNTNWWSPIRWGLNKPPADPADQFAWFEEQIHEARDQNQKIIVVGHIPPAHSFFKNALEGFSVDSQWVQMYNEKYFDIIRRHSDIIGSQLFGHFHTDQFRIQMVPGAKEPKPLGIVLLAPGICPNHGTNPAWRHVHYEDGQVVDYEQFSSRLYGIDNGTMRDLGTWDGTRFLSFRREYAATERFKVKSTTARHMFKSLWTRLTNKDTSMYKYWSLEEVEAMYPPAFLMRCVIQEDYNPDGIRQCAQQYIQEYQDEHEVVAVS